MSRKMMVGINQKTAITMTAGAVCVTGMCILFSDSISSFNSESILITDDMESMEMPMEIGYIKTMLQMSSATSEEEMYEYPDTVVSQLTSTSGSCDLFHFGRVNDDEAIPDVAAGSIGWGVDYSHNPERFPLK